MDRDDNNSSFCFLFREVSSLHVPSSVVLDDSFLEQPATVSTRVQRDEATMVESDDISTIASLGHDPRVGKLISSILSTRFREETLKGDACCGESHGEKNSNILTASSNEEAILFKEQKKIKRTKECCWDYMYVVLARSCSP